MSDDTSTGGLNRRSAEEMSSTISSIKKMLVVGAGFVVLGYLLTGSALFF